MCSSNKTNIHNEQFLTIKQEFDIHSPLFLKLCEFLSYFLFQKIFYQLNVSKSGTLTFVELKQAVKMAGEQHV